MLLKWKRKIAQIRANHLQLVDTRKYLWEICSPWTIYSSRKKDSRVLGRKENDFVNLKFIHENDFPSMWTRVDVWWSSLATEMFLFGQARELISIAIRNLMIFQLGWRKNSIKRWNWIKRMSRCSERSLATIFFPGLKLAGPVVECFNSNWLPEKRINCSSNYNFHFLCIPHPLYYCEF